MVKNKAPEQQSPNSKEKTRVKTLVFAKCCKTQQNRTKNGPKKKLEKTGGPEIPRNKARKHRQVNMAKKEAVFPEKERTE